MRESAPPLKCAYLQPHATFHTEVTNQVPKPERRLNHRSTTQLVNYSLVSLTSWPIEPWLNEWPAQLIWKDTIKVHLQLHYCICISLKWALLAVQATPLLFVLATLAEITKDINVMQLAKPKWKRAKSNDATMNCSNYKKKKAIHFITHNESTL